MQCKPARQFRTLNKDASDNDSWYTILLQLQSNINRIYVVTKKETCHGIYVMIEHNTHNTVPTAMWAARTMQAAHTVRPADQKPEYYRIARNFRGRKPSQISWFEANS